MSTRARGSAALVAGSAVSGLLAYVFFALVTRALGGADAAPVSVLWTYWSFAAAGVTFPVQHWIVLMAFSSELAAAYAVALASGQLIGFVWPATFLPRGRRGASPAGDPEAVDDGASTWAGFLGGAASAQLLSQAVLTGGPVVLAL